MNKRAAKGKEMSRTHHVARGSSRPHRQRAPSRLTRLRGEWYFPYEQRPLNKGGSRRPGGGYAKDCSEHALYKKIGRRLERRRHHQCEDS